MTDVGRERTRVLQVLWRLSVGGGAPMVVRSLLEHVDTSAFDVHVCTVRPIQREEHVASVEGAVEYHPLGLEGRSSTLLRLRAVIGIARLVRRLRPDVIHLHSGTAWLSALAALATRRSGRVIEVHDAPQSARLSAVNLQVERAMHRWLGFRPMVHSTAVRDGVADAWEIDPAAVPLVPLGVDVEKFSPSRPERHRMRDMLGVPADVPLVVYVARLVPEKRPELFVEVARLVLDAVSDARFALAGGGALEASIRSQVESRGLGGSVLVPGFVEDLPALYSAGDVFLSTSRYEGFGLAVAEAMASGLPVISTSVGGVVDVIGDAGVLVDTDEAGPLARAVIDLLGDVSKREELARRGRERTVRMHDARDTARSFEELYWRLNNT